MRVVFLVLFFLFINVQRVRFLIAVLVSSIYEMTQMKTSIEWLLSPSLVCPDIIHLNMLWNLMKSMCENMVCLFLSKLPIFYYSLVLLGILDFACCFDLWLPLVSPVVDVTNPYMLSFHGVWITGGKKVDVLLVGMNPGPFGMAQVWLGHLALLQICDGYILNANLADFGRNLRNSDPVVDCECVKTGVPFGDSVVVREFLHITSEV